MLSVPTTQHPPPTKKRGIEAQASGSNHHPSPRSSTNKKSAKINKSTRVENSRVPTPSRWVFLRLPLLHLLHRAPFPCVRTKYLASAQPPALNSRGTSAGEKTIAKYPYLLRLTDISSLAGQRRATSYPYTSRRYISQKETHANKNNPRLPLAITTDPPSSQSARSLRKRRSFRKAGPPFLRLLLPTHRPFELLLRSTKKPLKPQLPPFLPPVPATFLRSGNQSRKVARPPSSRFPPPEAQPTPVVPWRRKDYFTLPSLLLLSTAESRQPETSASCPVTGRHLFDTTLNIAIVSSPAFLPIAHSTRTQLLHPASIISINS